MIRIIFLFFLFGFILFGCSKTSEKPNIVWICAEDITTILGCYGDPNALTSHLDAFSEKSVKCINALKTLSLIHI
jgi:prophage antirepressor-like protein